MKKKALLKDITKMCKNLAFSGKVFHMKPSPGFGGERSRRKEGRELMERERREERKKSLTGFSQGFFPLLGDRGEGE